MKGPLSEGAQAAAADLLFLGALVSIASAMLFVFSAGTRQADARAAALRQRYVGELVQGVFLSSRYLEKDCSLASGGNYTIELGVLDKGGLAALSGFIEGVPLEGSPLERKLCGDVLELIADDLVFGLDLYQGGAGLSLNRALVGEGYHEEVERVLNERFERLAPGVGYRIVARYSPLQKPQIEGQFYSEVNYTNARGVPSSGVYAARFQVPVPYALGPQGCVEETYSFAVVEVLAWSAGEGNET